MTQLAHKVRLYPNKDAIAYFQRCAGTARFAWNWALASWKKKYDSGERNMSGYSLVKEFNALKGNDFPLTHDRDVNAAKNLSDVARRYRENLNVCGGEVSPDFQGEDLAFPMKQKSGALGC